MRNPRAERADVEGAKKGLFEQGGKQVVDEEAGGRARWASWSERSGELRAEKQKLDLV